MTDNLIASVTTIAVAIVGIAILAVLVSNRAQTANVIMAGTSGFANDIAAAVSPVTGGTFNFGGGASLPTIM